MYRAKMLNIGTLAFVACTVMHALPYDMDAINELLDFKKISYSIPRASYALSTADGTSFYTCDGDLIVTVPRQADYVKKHILLDKNAPDPRPVAFEIQRYKPSQKAAILSFGTARISGFFSYEIYFYDKNGNTLAWSSYNGPIPATRESLKQYESIKMLGNKGLDLSGIVEDRTWLWTHPLTWFKRFKVSSR